jgi:hypothetical protein
MSSPLIKSPLEMLYEQAGIPHMQAGGRPPMTHHMQPMTINVPYGTGLARFNQRNGIDMTPPNPIDVYRADPTGKFGGKDRMETMPTRLDKTTIEDYIKAMRAGAPIGVPQLTQDQLAKMLLTEGRSDFGYNQLNENNKKALYKADLLQEMGHNRLPAEFAAALYDKQQLANRINRPLQEVWNGTGRSGITGRTGAQHNQRFNEFGYAVDHPKNAELMNTINSAYNYQPPVKQELGANEYANPMGDYVPTVEQNKPGAWFATGGSVAPKSFYDMSKILIQKHLSGN